MRRGAICLLFLLLFAPSGYASEQSDGLLRDLSAAIKSLGRYEARFTIESNGDLLDFVGRYAIDGERYMLDISGAVIYGDSRVRYTVDSLKREVIVERVTDDTPMLTSNPARAFTSLDEIFSSTLKSSDGGYYTLSLRPKGKITLFQRAELRISQDSSLPTMVSYRASGDQVVIRLSDFAPIAEDTLIPRVLDAAIYPAGYEVIDFR